MSSFLSFPYYLDFLHRNLGRAPTFKNDVGMWIEQEAARRATEKSSRNHGIGVTESVTPVELFLQVPLASRAPELPVESIKTFGLGSENILETFNCFPD